MFRDLLACCAAVCALFACQTPADTTDLIDFSASRATFLRKSSDRGATFGDFGFENDLHAFENREILF